MTLMKIEKDGDRLRTAWKTVSVMDREKAGKAARFLKGTHRLSECWDRYTVRLSGTSVLLGVHMDVTLRMWTAEAEVVLSDLTDEFMDAGYEKVNRLLGPSMDAAEISMHL